MNMSFESVKTGFANLLLFSFRHCQLMVIASIELFTTIFNALDPTQRTSSRRLHREEIRMRVPDVSDMLRPICRIGGVELAGVYQYQGFRNSRDGTRTRNMEAENWWREHTPQQAVNYSIDSPTIFTTVVGTRHVVVNKIMFPPLMEFTC